MNNYYLLFSHIHNNWYYNSYRNLTVFTTGAIQILHVLFTASSDMLGATLGTAQKIPFVICFKNIYGVG